MGDFQIQLFLQRKNSKNVKRNVLEKKINVFFFSAVQGVKSSILETVFVYQKSF
jgi:hypothetical protein